MKKKLGIVTFSTIGIVYLVLNVILFILINRIMPQQFSNGVFWFVWFMTFIFNAGVSILVFLFYKSSSKYDDVTVPPLIFVMGAFNVVYIILGLILMFIPPLKITLAIILELLVTAAYALFLIYFFSVTNHMKANNANKKVVFIRSLCVDLDHANQFVTDQELQNKIKQLSEDVRFSDPMSQGEIVDLDAKLQEIIQAIVINAMEKRFDVVNELVDKASIQLKYRNAKCKMLK